MISLLIAVPLFVALTILQSAVIAQMPLLDGTPDLVLLVVAAWAFQERVRYPWGWMLIGSMIASLGTALPFGALMVVYGGVNLLAMVLRKRVWRAPVLAMLVTVFLGTLFLHGVEYFVIALQGKFLPIGEVFYRVSLPSEMLNLLIAIPIYFWIRDLAEWLYPKALEA